MHHLGSLRLIPSKGLSNLKDKEREGCTIVKGMLQKRVCTSSAMHVHVLYMIVESKIKWTQAQIQRGR